MEFLPRYVSGEIWANQLIGLMKDDDGDKTQPEQFRR